MSAPRSAILRFMAVFAGGTMLSRVLGLVRSMLMAYLLPPLARDVFTVAFKFPNMLRDLVGEGASNAAFVPVFSEYNAQHDPETYKRLIQSAMGAMIVVLGALTLAGLAVLTALPYVLEALSVFTPTKPLQPEHAGLYTRMSLLFFPYIFFIGLAVFAMGPLFVAKRYGVASWSPALLNVALIAAIVLGAWFGQPYLALAAGVWAGGIAQLVVQFRALRTHCGVWTPRFDFLTDPGVRRIFLLLVPVLIGQAAGEVNKLVDTLFAAQLEAGTPFALMNANLLVQLPQAVFGLAVAAAILPTMSASSARKDIAEVRVTLMNGLRQSAFLILPSMAGLILLREPIVRLLFEHGEFRPRDTELTADALGVYAAGLLAFAWVKVILTGFYALQDTKTPVKVAAGAMILNILLNFALVGSLAHIGLALATTVSYSVNFLFLYLMLSHRMGWLFDAPFLDGLARIAVAAAAMAAIGYGAAHLAASAWPFDTLVSRMLVVAAPIAACVAVYLAVARLLNIRELTDFAAALSRRR